MIGFWAEGLLLVVIESASEHATRFFELAAFIFS